MENFSEASEKLKNTNMKLPGQQLLVIA